MCHLNFILQDTSDAILGLRTMFSKMVDISNALANDGNDMQTNVNLASSTCSYASYVSPYIQDYATSISSFYDMVFTDYFRKVSLYAFNFILLYWLD